MTQDGKISKKSWKIDEDARLLQLVSEYGLNGHWTTISAKIGNRSGKQCRERYHNHLKPDICKDAWTQEEDDLLNDSQKLMGNQWAKIAKLLPGRSDNSVKNRWHIINRNKLNEPQLANAVVTNPVARPQIPKLSLNMLRSAAPVQNITPLVEQDLLSFYYSHDSHEHYHRSDSSRAGTGRNDMEFCPGSGRRDMSMTESAPELEGDEFDQFEAFIDRAMKEDNKPNNSVVSFNNTMSSLVSDVTMEATFVDCDELDCCEYEDEIGDQVWESTLCHFRCASAVEMCDNTTVDASIDRFSEPALSFREMDSVLDDLGNDCDEDDSLAMFDDLMDLSTCANTLQNASPFRKHCVQDLTRFVSYLQYKLSPRTTPRSPLCPPNLNSKKQRAGRTPRSPYQLVNSMLGRQ